MAEQILVKKITLKDIGAQEGLRDLVEKHKTVKVAAIVGIAKDVKSYEGKDGPGFKLRGDFKALNYVSGVEYRSGECIMPAIANDLVVGALADSEAQSVDFAFEILATKIDFGVGYKFLAKPLIQPKESDALAALTSLIHKPTEAAQLSAPAPTATPAPEKKAEPVAPAKGHEVKSGKR